MTIQVNSMFALFNLNTLGIVLIKDNFFYPQYPR